LLYIYLFIKIKIICNRFTKILKCKIKFNQNNNMIIINIT